MADVGARLLVSFLTVFVCRIHFGTLGYHPAVDKYHAARHNHHEAQCDQHEKHRLNLERGSATSTASAPTANTARNAMKVLHKGIKRIDEGVADRQASQKVGNRRNRTAQ